MQAWDRYGYVNNNPLRYNDPSGHAVPLPPSPFANIYIPVSNGWDLVAGAACFVLCGFLPVHFERYGPGEGAIVGDETLEPTLPFIAGVQLLPEAAAFKAAEQGFKRFTARNFRENLMRLSGKSADEVADLEAHHVFPQALEEYFQKLGIENIHDPRFGSWVEPTAHRRWSYAYNQKWIDFLEQKPTREAILNFAKRLAKEYEFDVHFP